MYELFYFPSNASLAPHFVLEEVGAPFELRLVDRKTDGQKDPAYMKRNPLGRIPTLVDGDLVLFESAAICLHLADRHPDADLVPAVGSDERAHLYKWLMFLTNTIQPDFMAFFYPEKHTTSTGGVDAVKASAEGRLDAAYAVVNDALGRGGPYLLGERISVADFYLLMEVHWGSRQTNRPKYLSNIRRCVDLVAQRPSVQRAAAAEGLGPLY
jgi:glutathione S-transferase